MRLSIEVSAEQHSQLKAAAALQGKSIKSYVLDLALPDPQADEHKDLRALDAFLKPRIDAAENGFVSEQSVDDIVNDVLGLARHS